MTSVVLFSGPTATAAALQGRVDCTVLPPARQGDIFHAVNDLRPRIIGLIDGVFLDLPSVWHREILWALCEGVHVFGAASMGALRAAELDGFGMRGVGRVYEAYRDGIWPGWNVPFEDDDEVAVVHAPPALGSAALSDAMVDLRDTLISAEQAGLIDRGQRDTLAAEMKALPFARRSFAALEQATAQIAGADAAAALRGSRVSRKRLDALAMADAIAAFLITDPPPFAPDFHLRRTINWQRFVARSEVEAANPDPDTALLLDELRLDPDAWQEAAWAAAGRATIATEARGAIDIDAALDSFRRARGLLRAADLQAWMRGNGLDEAGLMRLLHQEARLAAADPPPAWQMLDFLRVSGRAAALRERAERKRPVADSAAPPPQTVGAALDWYFHVHLGRERPARLDTFLRLMGWRDVDHFERAVWAEYRLGGREALKTSAATSQP